MGKNVAFHMEYYECWLNNTAINADFIDYMTLDSILTFDWWLNYSWNRCKCKII